MHSVNQARWSYIRTRNWDCQLEAQASLAMSFDTTQALYQNREILENKHEDPAYVVSRTK